MDPSSTSHWTPHADAVMIMANSESEFIARVDTKARIHVKKPIWSTAAVPGLGLTAVAPVRPPRPGNVDLEVEVRTTPRQVRR